MRDRMLIVVAFAGLSACASQPDHRPTESPPDTVASVDLERYAGKWYEVARYPNRFEDKLTYRCVGVTAEYALRDDGRVAVTNTCYEDTLDGPFNQVEGVARSVSESNARLEVSFAPEWVKGAWGDYWILDLTEDYQAALVGDPEGRYLWVLSREPQLPSETYESLLETARAQGYATEPLERVPQPTSSD